MMLIEGNDLIGTPGEEGHTMADAKQDDNDEDTELTDDEKAQALEKAKREKAARSRAAFRQRKAAEGMHFEM
jgi:hypothetical protein